MIDPMKKFVNKTEKFRDTVENQAGTTRETMGCGMQRQQQRIRTTGVTFRLSKIGVCLCDNFGWHVRR
jgi:hypothetical protein